jgi:hypothetical protein
MATDLKVGESYVFRIYVEAALLRHTVISYCKFIGRTSISILF